MWIRRGGNRCGFRARANIRPMSVFRLRDACNSPRLSGRRDRPSWRNHRGRSRRGVKRTTRSAICWPGRRSAPLRRPRHARTESRYRSEAGNRLKAGRQRQPESRIQLQRADHGSGARSGAGTNLPNRLRGLVEIVQVRARRLLPGSSDSTLCSRWPGASCTPSCSESRLLFATHGRAGETDRPILPPLMPRRRDAVSQSRAPTPVVGLPRLACVSQM